MTLRQCDPGANQFIELHFHDCIYSIWDFLGFLLGLSAIFIWLVAQLPQFISNIKNQSAEALSVWFLAQWFAGDTLNLLGCLIQGHQLPTTTLLAMYFVLSDMVMLIQYIYYGALQARRKRLRKNMRRMKHRQSMTKASQVAAAKLLEALIPAEELLVEVPHALPHSEHHRAHTPPPSPPCGPEPPPAAPPPPMGDWPTEDQPGGLPAVVHRVIPYQQQPGTTAYVLIMVLAVTGLAFSAMNSSSGSSNPAMLAVPGGRRLRFLSSLTPSSLAQPHVADSLTQTEGSQLALTLAPEQQLQQQQAPSEAMPGSRTNPCCHPGVTFLCWLLPWKPEAAYLQGAATSQRSSDDYSGDDTAPYGSSPPDVSPPPDSPSGDNGGYWNNIRLVAGTLCGYISCIMYLSSRVSQIAKNINRQSVEGLSALMFLMALMANLFTGSSIIFRLHNWQALLDQLPWICGAYGTVAMDVFIFYQTFKYADQPPHHHHHRPSQCGGLESAESKQLLESAESDQPQS